MCIQSRLARVSDASCLAPRVEVSLASFCADESKQESVARLSDASTSASSCAGGEAVARISDASTVSASSAAEFESPKLCKTVSFGDVEILEIDVSENELAFKLRPESSRSMRLAARYLNDYASPHRHQSREPSSRPKGTTTCLDQFVMASTCLVGVLGVKVGLTPLACLVGATFKAKQSLRSKR